MLLVKGIDKLLSISPRKRFGKRWEYGTRFYGDSNFADFEKYITWQPFGSYIFGDFKFGDVLICSGIWREFRNSTGRYTWFGPYYIPKNPYNEEVQANREKFADAVYYWRFLDFGKKIFGFTLYGTSEVVYNKISIGKRMSGYNAYLKEYLLSH